MAQISMKIVSFFLLKHVDLFFYATMFKLFLYDQIKVMSDLLERKNALVAVGISLGLGLSIMYRIRNLEKQDIEIKKQKEELRALKLKNDAEEARQQQNEQF